MSITMPPSYPPAYPSVSSPEPVIRRRRGLADTQKRWPDGVVTVALNLRDEKSKALVVDAIREWAHHTPGLRFKIVEGTQGDIRISDDEGLKGNWSAIGTDAKTMDADQPTMHLDRTDDSKKFRSTALHEFGHALGLMHEHQHPENTVKWDRPATYRYYGSETVSGELINEQLLNTFSGPALLITPYDQRSVMHYPIPAEVTQNQQSVPARHSLSEGDKENIRKLYTRNFITTATP